MKPNPIKVHADNGDHFVVSHNGGAPFRIAKKGIDKKTMEKIQAHHTAQMLDTGGSVAPDLSATAQDPYQLAGLPGSTGLDRADPAQLQALADAPDARARAVGSLDSISPLTGRPMGAMDTASPEVRSELAGGEPPSAPPSAPMSRDAETASLVSGYQSGALGTASKPQDVPATGQATPTADTIPQAKKSGSGLGGGDAAEVTKGFNERADAERTLAKSAEARAAETAVLQNDYLATVKQRMDSTAQQFQKYQARADAVAEQIANGKIDPNHFYASQSTGQRIGGAIALILGGLASGYAGQPSAVQGVIDKAIDRDIEAQKANLGKQQSLLSHYMQQGHSVLEASQLAKADLSDYFAAQLGATASKYAGADAQALAQAHIGELRDGAASRRSAIAGQTQDRLLKGAEIQQKQIELGMMQRNMGVQQMLATGKLLPPEYESILDPKLAIRLPGGVTEAKSEGDAKAVRDAQEQAGNLKALIGRIEAYRTKNPHGTYFPGTDATGEGHSLHGQFKEGFEQFLQRTRAAGGGEEANVDSILGDPANIKNSGSYDRQLAQAKALIDERLLSTYETRRRGGKGVTGGLSVKTAKD